MKLTEKMSYLQGMLDGLDIDTSTKEGKLLVQMTEVMITMILISTATSFMKYAVLIAVKQLFLMKV